MILFNFVSKILIIIGLCLTSANAPTLETLQDKIAQSVQHQFVVADEEAISRPVSSAKPRPKTHFPVLLPITLVVIIKANTETTYFNETNFSFNQTVSQSARGPPIS